MASRPEDAIDITGRAPKPVDEVRSIGDQAAGGDEETFNVDCRQPVPGRQCDDQIAMKCRRRASRCDQTAIPGTRECGDGALNLTGIAYVDRGQFNAQ